VRFLDMTGNVTFHEREATGLPSDTPEVALLERRGLGRLHRARAFVGHASKAGPGANFDEDMRSEPSYSRWM
jgi:hypothetical protein